MRLRIRLAALLSGSSFVLTPILTLRKPDAQSEIAPQRLHPAWHSRCLHSSCASTSFPPRPAVFASLRGIGAVSLGHTPASVAILRSLACASPLIAIARAKNPASKRVQGTIFSDKNRGRPKCNAETDTACRFVITHWRFYRTSMSIALHIPLNQKAVFVLRSAGRSGEP